jgi:DNA polymerase III delta subunit
MAMTATKVYWFSGNYHERKALLSRMLAAHPDHEVRRFEGDYTFPYLDEQVSNGSCFSEKRLFIIKDFPKPATTRPTMLNHMKKMLDNLPDDLTIVFNGIDDEDTIATYIGKSKVGKVVPFPVKLEPNAAPGWIVSKFAENGKTITIEDAQLIVDLNGYDPMVKGVGIDAMNLVIKKLCMYLGGKKKTVTKEDIMVTAFPSEEFIIWTISDALDSKDIERCYDAWNKLLNNTTSGGVSSAIHTLFAVIQARYRLLVFLREGMAKNLPKAQLAKEAAAFVKLKQSGKDFLMTVTPEIVASTGQPAQLWSEFVIQAALNGNFGRKPAVDNYSRKELFRIIQVIQDAQVEMRYRTTDAGLTLLVDALFFAVCGKMDDTQLATLRKSND